jgi:glycine/D-amino acid oxidase-like deaminating enzyme/folate-dependent phosphoribosylglycinamide formyltransferase PurN
MKFLISTDIPDFAPLLDHSPHLDLCDIDSKLALSLTGPIPVDLWICDGKEVTNEVLYPWLNQALHAPKILLVKDGMAFLRLEEATKGRAAKIAKFPRHTDPELTRGESILREAELLYAHARAHQMVARNQAAKHDHKKSTVLVVGAGIMNLVTAELLVTRGFQVRIIDKGPDPRSCNDWTRLGVTNGGGNARMFTHTEADNYNEKSSKIYQDMRSIFRQTTRKGGWSVKTPKDFTTAELAWINSFEQLPPWLARAFKEDIYKVNQQAGELWQTWIASVPHLFEEVGLRQGILRMYVEPGPLEAALKLNRKLDTITENSSKEEFVRAHPTFSSAVESNELAGGFAVEGFTVNIHPFVAKLIGRITDLGGEFTWDCHVQSMHRNSQGQVTSLDSQLGPLEADHFVVSPGVTGDALLRGTASENLIHGVLGVWLQIPNVQPKLLHSTKIHRRGHLVEDINITVAQDDMNGESTLVLGGGYGYVGLDRPSPDSAELTALFSELEEVARIYFPHGYALGKQRGTLWPEGNRKFCVRPFTPTGLGVFEEIPTATGGHLVITGGNNTGGFAQAPAVARAVWRALVGESDPIHTWFHPDRGKPPTAVTFRHRFSDPSVLADLGSSPPLNLLLLCSDGPQHDYLRYRFSQAFPGCRCIVETNEGQVRDLLRKGRRLDAAYMIYHDFRRYALGSDRQRKAYFERLLPQKYTLPSPDLIVDNLNCREVWEKVEKWQPELTVVSGTKYIGRKLNQRGGLMINLHIGHLPEYKGNHCLFFALYEGALDKIAATLHVVTPKLDAGAILDTVFAPVISSDNEDTLYTRCTHMAIERALEYVWQFSRGQNLVLHPQTADGRMFRHRDRTLMKELWLWWSIVVCGLLGRSPIQYKQELAMA